MQNEQKPNFAEAENKNRPSEQKIVNSPMGNILDKDKENSGVKKFFMGFLISLVSVFVIFYGLALWSILNVDNNEIFQTLNINPEDLKSIILDITNYTFGGLSLIFFLGSLIKFFQWLVSSAESFERKKYIKKSIILISVSIFLIILWMVFYKLISATEFITKNREQSLIKTIPEETINLDSPITIKFDIGQLLYQEIPANLIKQINWDLNEDGVFDDASGSKITKEFLGKGEKNGRFNVFAEVIYTNPKTGEEQTYVDNREIIITNELISAIITADKLSGQSTLAVKLSAEQSFDPDGEIVFYEWDLDNDGNYEISGVDEKVIDNVFSLEGTYIVNLRVTGTNEDQDVASKTITVSPPLEKIRAKIVSPDSKFEGTAPMEITFDGSESFSKSGYITTYEWKIEGEDQNILNRTVKRTFEIPGTYKVSLTIENTLGERDFKEIEVIVRPNIKLNIQTDPSFDQDKILRGVAPFSVVFDSAKSTVPKAVEWQWDFSNDGIIDAYGEKVNHVFRETGQKEVKLKIIDSDNQEFEIMQMVEILSPQLMAIIKADKLSGESPLVINFDGSASQISDGEIISYIWEFPNLDPLFTTANVSKEFKEVGIFPVKLTIVTDKGKRSSTEVMISIRSENQKTNFQVIPKEGLAPLKVKFLNLDDDNQNKNYYWDFGDGNNSREISPTNIFQTKGEYLITLKATDKKGIVRENSTTIIAN